MQDSYDVIIIGGGITGASLLYMLSRYTDAKRILLLEKFDSFAALNSNSINNAQTLHFGDIETNYSLEKSRETKEEAEIVLKYLSMLPRKEYDSITKKCGKMVLGVGEDEIQKLDKIYDSGLKHIFPGLKKIGPNEIAKLEPNVMKKRAMDEKVQALKSDNGQMMDFRNLTYSFIKRAKLASKGRVSIKLNTTVTSIEGSQGEFQILANGKKYHSKFVVFCSGSYSLYFAKMMGYEKNLSILCVGGNFYTSPKVLNGKVYRVQMGGIPFAAVHGDPDITNPRITRFGPTVSIYPELEKGNSSTFSDYMKTFDFDLATTSSLFNILLNKDIRRILWNNMFYDMPGIGTGIFLKNEVSKIVPSLTVDDVKLAPQMGGIRPQIIDENKKALVLGESKIKEQGIIFNITPSPGATSCLASAIEDTSYICDQMGLNLDIKAIERNLVNKDSMPITMRKLKNW